MISAATIRIHIHDTQTTGLTGKINLMHSGIRIIFSLFSFAYALDLLIFLMPIDKIVRFNGKIFYGDFLRTSSREIGFCCR